MAVKNTDVTSENDVQVVQCVNNENILPPCTNSNTNSDIDYSHDNHKMNGNTSSHQKHQSDIENQQSDYIEQKQGKATKDLLVEVLTGPHEGATYLLKPRPSRPCEIGRSKGKKFLSRGVSLHKDSEVSTCHGKFELKAGKMFYTDTGSTNGTSYMGEAIQDNVPMEIENGMILVFGVSELKFTLLDHE
jgi:hypothetical protein